MPIDMSVMATLGEHARRNAVSNAISDIEIASRLRRKGYKKPERAIEKFVRSERWNWMPYKVVESIFELIEEQDAARAAGVN